MSYSEWPTIPGLISPVGSHPMSRDLRLLRTDSGGKRWACWRPQRASAAVSTGHRKSSFSAVGPASPIRHPRTGYGLRRRSDRGVSLLGSSLHPHTASVFRRLLRLRRNSLLLAPPVASDRSGKSGDGRREAP